MAQPTGQQPPKRFLPALATAPETVRVGAMSTNGDASPSQIQAFDEYKRKHSRQNRDIIKTNVDRAYRIRLLEEENVELQTEVLTVRHEKAIVSEELRRERAKTEKIKNNPEIKQALDILLLAIPQISQLRSLLSTSSSNSQASSETDSKTNLRTRSRGMEAPVKKLEVQTWLNRPAIVKAGKPGLENLTESNEEMDEVVEVEKMVLDTEIHKTTTKPVAGRAAGRRQSGLFRPVVDDQPNPFSAPPTSRTPVAISVPEKAPAESQVRKSPRKKVPSVVVASTFDEVTMDMDMGVRKSPRKRTTRPNYTEEQVIESPVPVKSKLKDITKATTETTAKRRRSLKPIEGGLVMRAQVETVEIIDSLEPNDAEERPSAERVEDVLEQENEMEARGIREATPPAQHEQTLMRMAKAAGSTTVPSLAIPSYTAEFEAREEEEAGGRQRRARKSVNYKEPSLHYKMRKPESVDKNGHLYVSGPSSTGTSRSRSITPSSTPGRKMVSTPLDQVPSMPPLPSSLRSEAGIGTDASYGLVNLETVNPTVMRRKSVLPKSRRVESLVSEELQNGSNGLPTSASDAELPVDVDDIKIRDPEKPSSRRLARLGTPETDTNSPSRQPLREVTPVNEMIYKPANETHDLKKPEETMAKRARRRSTLFQSTYGES